MDIHTVTNQAELEELMGLMIWEDCIIQNTFVLSASYCRRDIGVVADASKPDVIINIMCSQHKPKDIHGIQLRFLSVEMIGIPVNAELNPKAKLSPSGNEITWAFTSGSHMDIRGQTLQYGLLTEKDLDYIDTYVFENPFSEGGIRKS